MKYLITGILIFLIGPQNEENASDNPEVSLHRFIPSECAGDKDPYLIQDRIISQEIKNDSLYLTVGFSENCCIAFNPTVSYEKSNLDIKLIQETPDEICECNCCFELTLVLTGLDDLDFSTSLDGKKIELSNEPYRTRPIEFEIYQGDTINLRNKYGVREGLWIFFDDSTDQIASKIFYSGIVYPENTKIWREHYNDNGILTMRSRNDSTWRFYDNQVLKSLAVGPTFGSQITSYYPNGNKKSECRKEVFYNENSEYGTPYFECTYWSINGQIDSTKSESYGPK